MLQLTIGAVLGTRIYATPTAPAPGNAYIAVPNEFSRDQTIFDSGAHLGLAEASIPLSGTTDAPDGTALQARAVSLEDGGASTTAWETIATAAGGSWFGTLSVPRAASWFRAETRVAGHSTVNATSTRFGAGHVWAIWEQSNWARLVLNNSGLTGLRVPITHPGDVQIVERGGALTALSDTSFLSPAMMAWANAFSAARPGEKLMVVWQCQSGTSLHDALTRADEDTSFGAPGGRNWSDDLAAHTTAIADGTQIGAVFVAGWIAATFGGLGANTVDMFVQAMLGKEIDGTDRDILADGLTGGFAVPRGLDQADGGIYDWGYSRLGWLGNHGRAPGDLVPGASVASEADLPGYGTDQAQTYTLFTERLDQVFNNTPALTDLVIPWAGVTHGAERSDGTGFDAPHMREDTPEGRQLLAQTGMFYALKQLGLLATDVPRLNGRYDDPTGAFADFWIAGVNLTTRRETDLAGYGAQETSYPHRTQVMGWSINQRPALNATLQVASGHPVLPDGQVYCRVLPNSGTFAPTDRIIYGEGSLPGYQVEEDYADRVFLDWLVVDMGQPAGLMPYLPVQHEGPFPQPTTLVAPETFTVANDTVVTSTASAPAAGATRMAFEIKGRRSEMSSLYRLFQLGSPTATPNIQITRKGLVRVTDGDGVEASLPDGTVSLNLTFHLRASWDRTTGVITLTDVQSGTTVTGTAGSTGTFQSRDVRFFRAGGQGSYERLAVWIGTATPDWSNDAPSYAIEGIAGAPHYAITGGMTVSGTPPTDGA